jgi:ubiquinone/menaquinone biosynthesis C-methylase UbiE
VFRDDTEHIERSLRAIGWSPVGTTLLEIGCGPGLYARRLATRHAGLFTVGIDQSRSLVTLARERAASEGLNNCRFERGDALALDWPDRSVDAVVTSRLLTVVDAPGVIGEVHRVLRPGGRYFLAEPAPVIGTAVPFAMLRVARWLADLCAAEVPGADPAPSSRRLPSDELTSAIETRRWSTLDVSYEHGYHYAVCQKPLDRTH